MAPSLGGQLCVARRAASPHRVLDQPGPQLVEIRRREPLPAQRVRPFGGEIVDQAIALGRETPRLPDEVGQPRRHRYSFASSRTASNRFASKRPVEAHWYTGAGCSFQLEPVRFMGVSIFDLTRSIVQVPLGSTKRVKATSAWPSTRSSPIRPQSA